jgi:hypothetical protein
VRQCLDDERPLDDRRHAELVEQLAAHRSEDVERALRARYRDIPPHLCKLVERLRVELTARPDDRQTV